MYVSSITFFVASWLVFCSIIPLYSKAQKTYRIPNNVDDSAYHQFQLVPTGTVPSDKNRRFNMQESPRIYPYYNRPYHSMHRLPTKDIYSEDYVRRNVTKSIPEYLSLEKEYRSQYVKSHESTKSESAISFLRQRHREARRKNKDVMRKMNMLDKVLSENSSENDIVSRNTIDDKIIRETDISKEAKRTIRQVRKQRPGFFWTLARLAFETFNDTRSAIKQITSIINNNLEPDMTTRLPITNTMAFIPSNDQSKMSSDLVDVEVTTTTTTTTTTPGPYRIRVGTLQSLIRRNIRGLVRLFNIEWQEAMNQSEISTREFRKDLGNQIGGFLQDNPDAF